MTIDQTQIQQQLQTDERYWADLTASERDEIQFKFTKAIMAIVFEYPFFGFLAVKIGTNPVWVKTAAQQAQMAPGWKTMATDGKRMYVWPQYVLYNPIEVLTATILHEIFHIVLLHVPRATNYHPELANIAMDYVVNLMVNDFAIESAKSYGLNRQSPLTPETYARMPWYIPSPPYYYDPTFREPNGDPMLWERVYDILLKRQDPETQKRLAIGQSIAEATDGQGLTGSPGQLADDHEIWKHPNRPADDDGQVNRERMTEHDAKNMIRDAYVQSAMDKTPGAMPAAMKRLIDEYLHPRLPWQRLVQHYLKPANGWFGYQPGDTRFADPVPWFVPDHQLRYILVSIDTSGSMDDADVARAVSETRLLLRGFPQTKGILCMVDTEVSYWADLSETYMLTDRRGYGGTSFWPPFQAALDRKLADQIDLHIYFTDGYGDFPDAERLRRHHIKFDTLWVLTNDQVTPPAHKQYRFTRFGETR